MKNRDGRLFVFPKGQSKILLFIDAFIVLMNVANYYTIFNYILFTPKRSVNTVILLIINCVYLFIRSKGKIHSFKGDYLFLLYILIAVLNVVFSIFSHTLIVGFVPFYLANISFYFILVTIFQYYRNKLSFQDAFNLTGRGYFWFFIINAFSVCCMQVLTNFFGIDSMTNDITYDYDLFTSNLEKFGSHYYWPYHLSVVLSDTDLRIPLFQDNGFFLGLFHEPHTFMFFISPIALYLIFICKSKGLRVLLILVFLVLVLSCGSVTNILAILGSLAFYMLSKMRKNAIVPGLVILLIIAMFSKINPNSYAFILDRFESGSADYSKTTLSFAIQPKTLIGTNFLDLSYWDHGFNNYDVGYIMFLLNIVFLIFLIFRVLKMLFSNEKYISILGMVSIYFLIHSTKQAMVTYTIPLLMYIIFISQSVRLEKSFSRDL